MLVARIDGVSAVDAKLRLGEMHNRRGCRRGASARLPSHDLARAIEAASTDAAEAH